MLSVRLHVAGDRLWALCKCRACGDVHKYSIMEATSGPVRCKRCGYMMTIKSALVESVERLPVGAKLKPVWAAR